MFWENMKWVWHVYPEKNLRNGSLNAPKLISPWFRKKGGKEGGKERGVFISYLSLCIFGFIESFVLLISFISSCF